MSRVLAGVGGTLFPCRYLSDRLRADARFVTAVDAGSPLDGERDRFLRWWRRAAERCGPATGLRALFDLVAMPLFGMLGYRARDAVFDSGRVRARLITPGGASVVLVVVAWASRPPGVWRDLYHVSRDLGAEWCFVLAPPFLSLVDVRGHATRHSLDVTFPAALEAESFTCLWTLARAQSFDVTRVRANATSARTTIDALIELAGRYQDRVRNDLQHGVMEALDALGAASNGDRDEALVIVYRILFLLFVEARDLVPRGHPIYERAYSVGRLVSETIADREARGAWDALAAITRLSRLGCRTDDLIVRPFNGRLFARRAAPMLEARQNGGGLSRRSAKRDEAMGDALIALGSRKGATGREEITYADLGVEQLGAVYERVLDLGPNQPPPKLWRSAAESAKAKDRRGRFRTHSLQRKMTGTFYTPQPLAEFVVRRTLAPLVAGVPADQILTLRIVDPAMGSGAFLVAACRYLARAYEHALLDEGRLAPGEVDEAARAEMRRLVAERCLAGVDANLVAVQLARLSMWLTTLAQGRPLTFLDHRLRTGNSLIGATPDDLLRVEARGPDRDRPLPLFEVDGLEQSMRQIVRPLADLGAHPDATVADVRAKEAAWQRLTAASSPLAPWRLAADAWCARWFPADGTRASSPAELRAVIDAIVRHDRTLPAAHLARRLSEARRAGQRHLFFHWWLEFSDVFYEDTGRPKETPGFDAVLGNPPWEVIGRDRDELTRFVRDSGVYRTCARGHLNLYQPFLERALSICRRGGRVGLIVPWGLAVDDGAEGLRKALVDGGSLETLVGLDNALALFPIHRGVRFAVIVANPGRTDGAIRARFGVRTGAELESLAGRDDPRQSSYPVRFTPAELRRVGGPTLRVPDVRHADDLALLGRLSQDFPPLRDGSGWAARFGRELNASDDRASFGSLGLPIVEGKHLEPFRVDVAAATLRIRPQAADRLLPDGRHRRARLGYRDVSSVSNMRSLIAAVLPANVVTTHTVFCLRTAVSVEASHFLCAIFNSLVMNLIVRMLMGGHVTTSLAEQLPVPVWRGVPTHRRITRLALRLSAGSRSDRLAARLDAEVAAMYSLRLPDYERIVAGFPLIPRKFKEMALEEFKKMT